LLANPNRLKLELTENLFVDNVHDIIAKMSELKSHGIQLSLDDFGTGYSSLAYLKLLPFDQLKIDKSFVQEVKTKTEDAAIAKGIITLAKSLGIEVIAEGVETYEQKEFFNNEGCHIYQGYYFSKPLPLEMLEIFLLNHKYS
jgi:EAL domain-containing protein (putative c-di-GMP-specific phosphodiesterase class I)